LLADEAFGHLDEVTAAELRATFLALARETGSTAILITHQLEEAIEVGDRIVVLGKSAQLLADIHVSKWPKSKHGQLRAAIQQTLQGNKPIEGLENEPSTRKQQRAKPPAKRKARTAGASAASK